MSPALDAQVLNRCRRAAAASTWALMLLGATLISETPRLAAEAGEGGRQLPEPVPEGIGIAAATVLAVIAFRLFRAVRTHRTTRRVLDDLRAGHPPDSELIVAASPVPRAIPGLPGRILVTDAVLTALDAAERRVLLTHERAHLTHRHAALATAVALATAANPLLAPYARRSRSFWADEETADAVGGRPTAARAAPGPPSSPSAPAWYAPCSSPNMPSPGASPPCRAARCSTCGP
ncbi:M48 family metalloprotease [Streptomyces rishiriensis]|uniref:M48 family metalloprotease n=1 Tax=Streptomyces rishiriensis TaxID=68264 RepID=UPI0037D8830E